MTVMTRHVAVVFVAFSAYAELVQGATSTAITTGYWDNPSTWDNGVPGLSTDAVVPSSYVVTITNPVSAASVTIQDVGSQANPIVVSGLGLLNVNNGAGCLTNSDSNVWNWKSIAIGQHSNVSAPAVLAATVSVYSVGSSFSAVNTRMNMSNQVYNILVGFFVVPTAGTTGTAYQCGGLLSANSGYAMCLANVNNTNCEGRYVLDGGGTVSVAVIRSVQGELSSYASRGVFQWNDGRVQNSAGGNMSMLSGSTNPACPYLQVQLAGTGTHQLYVSGTAAVIVTNNATITDLPDQRGTLLKDGPGTLLLGTTNTYSGVTTISNGTIVLAGDSAMMNSVASFDTDNRLIFSNGTTFALGGLAGTGNLALTNSAGSAVTLVLGGGNDNACYSGTLSGAGSSLIKVGTGTQLFAGTNTFPGPIVVSNGMIGGSCWLTNTVVTVAQGGGLAVPDTHGVLNLAVTTNNGALYLAADSAGNSGRLNVDGNLVLGANSALVLADTNVLNFLLPYTAVTVTNGSISGTFSSNNLPANWTISYEPRRIRYMGPPVGTIVRIK